ncbi:glycosyltransferase family 4 protein [Desulfosarcina alkanivorans]|nr:glycosyltransferase [Desulfosarcina alkanivorans]
MTNRIRLGIVRTRYGHWSSRSGYGLLGEYLRKTGCFDIVEFVTEDSPAHRRPGAEHAVYSQIPPWYSSGDQETECRVQAAVSEGRLDIVHFLDGEHGYYFSDRLGQSGSCRIVATYHQPERILRRGRFLGDGRQLEALDRLVILSESQRPFFQTLLPDAHIACIPHGVDTDFYIPPGKRPHASRPLQCLTVGFWLRDFEVISGVASAFYGRDDIQFTLVGLAAGRDNGAIDPGAFNRLLKLPNTRLLDRISDDELLRQYQDADLLFLPLRDCTANNVLLEGIASGLPVVTSDIPGTRYYLTDGCASFCPAGDVDAFAQALQDLKQDDIKRTQMGAAARALAESRFRWEKIAGHYNELYMSMMDGTPMASPERRGRKENGKRAVCTVISSDYLHLALALYYSIREHTVCDFYALVADNHWSPRLVEGLADRLPSGFHLLTRQDIASGAFHLADEDSLRWALKPTLMRNLLEEKNHDAVIFADSDVCFFDDIGFLFDALRTRAILLAPHWRPIDPGLNEVQFQCNLQHGLYNGGFVGAAKRGVEALRWWEGVCRYRCEKRVAEGFFVDQKYLDFLPVYFEGVEVLKHKGCNVAEWNAEQLPRVSLDGMAFVDNWPVVFIHFTGLTIRKIEQGDDAALLPYLERYRMYLERADREMAENRWHLLEEEAPEGLREDSPRILLKASEDAFAWCAVVNFLELPHFLIQWESLKAHTKTQPRILVGCADRESRNFLEGLAVPNFHILSWESLQCRRLAKQRQRHEGDDTGFRKIAVPFFIRHCCTRFAGKKLLYLANNVVFTASPGAWFSALDARQGNAVLFTRTASSSDIAGAEPTPIFLWLQGEDRLKQIDRWQTRMIRNTKKNPFSAAGLGEETGRGGAALGNSGPEQGIVFDPLPAVRPPSAGVSEPVAVCYDEAAFLLHDWDVFHGPAASGTQSPSPMQKRLAGLMETLRQCYHLSRSGDLDPFLDEISKRDMAMLASRRGIYLEDFGRRIREPWSGALSSTMNAYLLYLMAVHDRESGRLGRALRLFQGVAETATLMPDLYRSKAHHHLGQMAEERGEAGPALHHYGECLNRMPHHAEAKQRIMALTEKHEINS